MTETTLITGVTGFVGSHLLERLSGQDQKLYGTIRESSSLERCRNNLDDIELLTCNLVDGPAIFDIIDDIEPNRIYHLAGQSSVKSSWDSTYSLINNNIVASLNILEAVRKSDFQDTRVLLACSSEEYGMVDPDALPLTEDAPLNPVSPYAVSKATVDMFGYQYYKSHDISTIRMRAFNHTGPRRPDTYALSDFARQIVEIERGRSDSQSIHVGNLGAIRDYSDVRDIVQAYELAMELGTPGEVYNVSSSTGHSIRDLLSRLIALSDEEISVVQEDARMRPIDIPEIVGDSTKFRDVTGWEPEYDIDDTLSSLIEYWRDTLDE